jgi:hypothetical protein
MPDHIKTLLIFLAIVAVIIVTLIYAGRNKNKKTMEK